MDPITPLAAFSLSIALLNIFLSTIPTLDDKIHQVAQYRWRLRRHHQTLCECSMNYRLWLEIWGAGPTKDAKFYERVFSVEAWTIVQKAQADAINTLVEVTENLKLKANVKAVGNRGHEFTRKQDSTPTIPTREVPDPSTATSPTRAAAQSESDALSRPIDHKSGVFVTNLKAAAFAVGLRRKRKRKSDLIGDPFKDWTVAVKRFESDYAKEPDINLVKRIISIFGQKSRLDELVALLKSRIDELWKLSTNHYILAGHGSAQPKENEIERDLQDFKLGELGAALYSSDDASNDSLSFAWYLQLDLTVNEKDKHEAVLRSISRRGVVRVIEYSEHFVGDIKLRPLRGLVDTNPASKDKNLDPESGIDVCTSAASTGPRLAQMIVSKQKHESLQYEPYPTAGRVRYFSKDWRHVLTMTEGAGKFDLREALLPRRAELAIGTVVWMVLFWNTIWFREVRSCAFRCAVLHGSLEHSNVFFLSESHDEACLTDSCPSCAPSSQLEAVPEAPGTTAAIQKDDDATATPSTPKSRSGWWQRYKVVLSKHRKDMDDVVEPLNANATLSNTFRASTTQQRGRLDFLGVFLTELLLARPVFPESDDRGQLWHQVDDMNRELGDIIQFCFDNARRPEWNKTAEPLTLTQKKVLTESVLEPLYRYYKASTELAKSDQRHAARVNEIIEGNKDERYVRCHSPRLDTTHTFSTLDDTTAGADSQMGHTLEVGNDSGIGSSIGSIGK